MGMNHAPTILLFVHEEATEATNKQEMTRGRCWFLAINADDGRRTTDRHDRAERRTRYERTPAKRRRLMRRPSNASNPRPKVE